MVVLAGVPGMRGALAAAPASGASHAPAVALAFAAGSRSLFRARADAVFRSDDDGRHWASIALSPATVPRRITSLAVSSSGKGALYVGGRGIGVLRSEDRGRHWSVRNESLPSLGVTALAAHADRPETVYAHVDGHGIFRSEDGARHWRLMDAGPRGGITQFVHSNMPGSMQSGWLFAASPNGVQRAMDCFCGWRDAGGLEQPVHAVAYDPKQPHTVYAATRSGLSSSGNGGETWSSSSAPATGIEALVVTPEGVLLAAGADGRIFRRDGNAASWEGVDG
jgi:photosystem II stability/assembly factor-like uncharacterized protein